MVFSSVVGAFTPPEIGLSVVASFFFEGFLASVVAVDCFLKRHHLGVMMSFGCYFIGHIKAHSIVVNSW